MKENPEHAFPHTLTPGMVALALRDLKEGEPCDEAICILHRALAEGQEHLIVEALGGRKHRAVLATIRVVQGMAKYVRSDDGKGDFILPSKRDVLLELETKHPELFALVPSSKAGRRDWWKRCVLDYLPQGRGY